MEMLRNSTVVHFVNSTFSIDTFNGSHQDNVTVYTVQPLDHWSYIVLMSSVVLMFLSILMNMLVLKAFSSKDTKSMKSGFLIKGIIVVDIIVSLAFGTRVLPYILQAFGCDPVLSIICYEGVSRGMRVLLIIIQLYTSLAIAVDRLMSVVKPLAYHTNDYTAAQKTIIIGGLWVGSLIVFMVMKTFNWTQLPEHFARHICFWIIALDKRGSPGSILSTMLIYTGIFATPCLYFVLLGLIIIQRKRLRSMTELTMKLQRSNASLALTLLLVHASYLLCYMPGAINNSLNREDPVEGEVPGYDITPVVLFSTIYQCNTIIDPVIFTLRIRSVRNYMKSLLFGDRRRRGVEEQRETIATVMPQ